MRHRLVRVMLVLGMLSALLTGCSPTPGKAPAADGTPTVVYSFPLPPSPAPSATQAPRPDLASGSRSAWAFTILHTNDSRGYLDPCG